MKIKEGYTLQAQNPPLKFVRNFEHLFESD